MRDQNEFEITRRFEASEVERSASNHPGFDRFEITENEWMKLRYSDVLNAVERGDEKAKTKLAWLKLSGFGGAAIDEEGAVRLLEARVKQHDTDAMWILGVCCEYGRGIEEDIERAELLYSQANRQGNDVGSFFVSRGGWGRGTGKIRINREHVELVDKVLPVTPWTSVNLCHNAIRDEAAIKISRILMINTVLTTLDLGHNMIEEYGAKKISESLMDNSTLTQLNLSVNCFGEESMSQLIMINTTLTELNLYCTGIRFEAAKRISESLVRNNTLTRLNLGNNGIGDAGTKVVAESLMGNTTLTELDLEYNCIGYEGAKTISELLKVNSTLTGLNLHYNQIGDEGAEQIFEALMTNTSLTQLDLSENQISEGVDEQNEYEREKDRTRYLLAFAEVNPAYEGYYIRKPFDPFSPPKNLPYI